MPAPEIAALDEALARAGEDVVLRRIIGIAPNTSNSDVEVRATVRSYRNRDEEIAAGIFQDILLVIMSPTEIAKAQWPGGELASSTVAQPDVPRKNDKLIIGGRVRNIENVDLINIGDELVRIDLRVLG